MRRRDFIGLVGGAAASWPIVAQAQQPEGVRRIGFLMGIPETDPSSPDHIAALQRGLKERGWMEGRNIHIEYRWTTGNPDRLRAEAKELVGLHPDVLVAHTINPGIALKNETRTIPIVFCLISDRN
jgi:putative tryptophan/tyrosine transport system substrate-binding protein